MAELTVTPLLAHLRPTVAFDRLDDRAHLHHVLLRRLAWARTIVPHAYCLRDARAHRRPVGLHAPLRPRPVCCAGRGRRRRRAVHEPLRLWPGPAAGRLPAPRALLPRNAPCAWRL